MVSLVNALGEIVAALLRSIGLVGAQRRRAGIASDLDLLERLTAFPQFDRGTFAYESLSAHVALEVARLSGVELQQKRRRIPWGGLVLATAIGAVCGFYANRLSDWWYWVPLWAIAGLMGLAIIGMLLPTDQASPTSSDVA
jgi:hypothetical protein